MIHEAEPLMHHDNQDSLLSEATCIHKSFPIEDVVIEFQDASEYCMDPEDDHKDKRYISLIHQMTSNPRHNWEKPSICLWIMTLSYKTVN